jgi:ribonuclease HII
MRVQAAQFIIGIDEVGRGPLAGPVAVGAVVATAETLRRYRKIKESKQLSHMCRDEWHTRITQDIGPTLRYAVSYVSAKKIDEKGIAWAIRKALAESLKKLHIDPNDCIVLLDGGLKAPPEYIHQETIIRGDAKAYWRAGNADDIEHLPLCRRCRNEYHYWTS